MAFYIKRLANAGFAPDRSTIRSLAYQFAEKLRIQHKFSKEKEKAGQHWLTSFLERNKDISVRQAEGLSVARAQGMNREEVGAFFKLLEEEMVKHDLTNRPENIFNVDETGIQLINKPGKVLTAKGAKDVHVITPREKGETISLVACCSAEGRFLPPVLIMKGVNKKAEFSDGLPNGSEVYMNKKSSYINSELFLRWFKEQFIPKKPKTGKTLLILDGHTSHSNSIDLLDLANENDVIILCLPSHTTQALQPLDRSFFKPLKTFYNHEANAWMLKNKNRSLTRLQVGSLIGHAWGKAATVGTATSGFKACGIFPLNPSAIPDHFYAISDLIEVAPPTIPLESVAVQSDLSPQKPSTSRQTSTDKETPTKILEESNPIPKLPSSTVKRKQVACILTSPENVSKKTSNVNLIKGAAKKRKLAGTALKSSSSISASTPIKDDTNVCLECWENYYLTKKKTDWIKCSLCQKWLHESCTMYSPHCNNCGRELLRKKVRKNVITI